MIRKFVETPEFLKLCKAMGVNDSHIRNLQTELLANPARGDLIVGSGGARKIRVGSGQKGKSGSYRVFYTDFASYGVIFLWIVLDKREADNIDAEERAYIKMMNDLIKSELRRGRL